MLQYSKSTDESRSDEYGSKDERGSSDDEDGFTARKVAADGRHCEWLVSQAPS